MPGSGLHVYYHLRFKLANFPFVPVRQVAPLARASRCFQHGVPDDVMHGCSLDGLCLNMGHLRAPKQNQWRIWGGGHGSFGFGIRIFAVLNLNTAPTLHTLLVPPPSEIRLLFRDAKYASERNGINYYSSRWATFYGVVVVSG